MKETVSIDREALAQFVVFSSREFDNWDVYIPEGISDDDVWDGIAARNVTEVDGIDDGVEVHGEFTVPEVVDRIPAGGGARGEPPINPPEVVTEPREVWFRIEFTFEDLGYAEGSIEVV